MNTKTIALTITLTALTVVLSPAFLGPAIPAPFLPLVSYHIYEIPIVVAFFLIGAKYGFAVAALNAIVMQAVFPNSPFIRPLPNLLAVSSMLFGLFLAQKLTARRAIRESPPIKARIPIFATALGTLSRLAVMLSFNYVLIMIGTSFFGFQASLLAILTYLLLLAVFDTTMMLYTIPTSYFIARTVSKNLKLGSKILKEADS